MYLPYGCPREVGLSDPPASVSEHIIDLAFNSNGSLLAVATTERLAIWSGNNKHVPLGGMRVSIGDIDGNCCVIWKKDSSAVAAVTETGRLLICKVSSKMMQQNQKSSREIFSIPEWLENYYPATQLSMSVKGVDEIENWQNFPEISLQDLPDVILNSPITAICASRFGQHILLGTAEGELCEVSWLGEVLVRYNIVQSGVQSPSTSSNDVKMDAKINSVPSCILSGIRSLSFSDTLQLLVLVTNDGQISLCTTLGDVCCIQNISVSLYSAENESDKLEPESAVTRAVFCAHGALLAVGFLNGSLLLARVERSNIGGIAKVRSDLDDSHKSYSLNPADAAELAAATLDISTTLSHISEQTPLLVQNHATPDRSAHNKGMFSLEGVEVHPLHSLSLGSYTKSGPTTSLCFSSDTCALAVSYKNAIVLWNTDDGTRLSYSKLEGNGDSSVKGLAWGYHGYRLLGAVCGESGQAQRVIIYDLLRHAGSSLSSAMLCFQDSTRIVTLEARSWDSHSLYWRVLPCHGGYLASNAPLQHVSTSMSGGHTAVAGRLGMAVYNASQGKWRVFGNVHQERELEICGLCWWGEDVIIALAKQGSLYWLRLYPRTHLDDASLLSPPIRLPVGLKPSFFNVLPMTNANSNSETGSTVQLLVASQRSYMVYRFRCSTSLLRTNIGQTGVSFEITHQGVLPHVSIPQSNSASFDETASNFDAASKPRGNSRWSLDSYRDLCDGDKIGPPKRLFLIPKIEPTLLGIIDFDGNFAVLDLGNGHCSLVSSGVTSVIDLTSISYAWEDEEELGVHPSYLIQRRLDKRKYAQNNQHYMTVPRVPLSSPLTPSQLKPAEHEYGEEYSVWCPALDRHTTTQMENNLLSYVNEALALDPHAYADPESLALGLLPRKGAMVYVTQVVCKPRVGKDSSEDLKLPPCFEMRTRLRPLLHLLLRHLLLLNHAEEKNIVEDYVNIKMPRGGFELAAGVLTRLRKDPALAEAVPDTLELLLRACLESCHIADRGGTDSEHIRAITTTALAGALRLCMLGGGCFLEVVARVSRKMEPDWYNLMFPLRLGGDGMEYFEGAYPTHLMHACLEQGRLATAAWFLPLISDHMVSLACSHGASKSGNQLIHLLPQCMIPLTHSQWKHGLSHALCCCLLLRCLENPREHHLVPEVWLFACKRERSAASSSTARLPTSEEKTGSASLKAFNHPTDVQHTSPKMQEIDRPNAEMDFNNKPSILWRIGMSIFGYSTESPSSESTQPNGRYSPPPSLQTRELKSSEESSPASSNEYIFNNKSDEYIEQCDSIYGTINGRSAAAVLSCFIFNMFAEGRASDAVAAFNALATSQGGKDSGLNPQLVLSTLRPVVKNGKDNSIPAISMSELLGNLLRDSSMTLAQLLQLFIIHTTRETQGNEESTSNFAWFEVIHDLSIRVRHTETAIITGTFMRDKITVISLLAAAHSPDLKIQYMDFLDKLHVNEESNGIACSEEDAAIRNGLILLKEWGAECELAALRNTPER